MLVRLTPLMVESGLQVIPSQLLHGPAVALVHDEREESGWFWFLREAFHLRSAEASSTEAEEGGGNGRREMAKMKKTRR